MNRQGPLKRQGPVNRKCPVTPPAPDETAPTTGVTYAAP